MFLLIGEDPFRARLRVAELVSALVRGSSTEESDISSWPSPRLGPLVGVTTIDLREPGLGVDHIAMAARAQGLFDAPDEKRVVVVECAEAIADAAFIADAPAETALVLVALERVAPARRRATAKKEQPAAADLAGAVEAAGGRVERVARLGPEQVPTWISARARLLGVRLEPGALAELAAAAGADTERIEQELAKLTAYAGGAPVTAADVRALVPGAIASDVFGLTRAVVRRDVRAALAQLERLLGEGQAPQQILALLLWQFRVLLFASAMKNMSDAERMARAIRSSAGAIARWRGEARRLSQADVIRAYEALYATDLAIKQGRTDEATALMLCVLDLCGVANADVRDLVVGEPPRR